MKKYFFDKKGVDKNKNMRIIVISNRYSRLLKNEIGGMKMDISKRHKMILEAIISMYLLEKEPIASNSLLSNLAIDVSSATLRNEMALLTKLGYLAQPHVAAGRVPTNKAYRYYVENMALPNSLPQSQKDYINERFNLLDSDTQKLFQGTARLFSDLFKVCVVISQPMDIDMMFANFILLKTGRFNVAIVAVTSQGDVHTRSVRLNTDISDEELKQVSEFINMKLCFVNYADIDKTYYDMLLERFKNENLALSQVLSGVLNLISQAGEQNLYISGYEHLLNVTHQEKGIANLLRLLSNTELLKSIVVPKQQNVSIVFADELMIEDIENACFISTNLYGQSGVRGTFSIISAQTIDYEKMFLSVDYFAKLLTDTITGNERE